MERIPSSSARISFIGRYADLDRPDGAESRGRHLICFKSMTDPIGGRVQADEARLLKTAMFRDDARPPETMLAGVAYQAILMRRVYGTTLTASQRPICRSSKELDIR
jgi:hypothetical protein